MHHQKTRKEIHTELLSAVDMGYDLMLEYDSLVHRYGNMVMYQAETSVLQLIGKNDGITITDIAQEYGKTTSAYSQIIRRLKKKGLVEQVRDEKNKRKYMLRLTELGWELFHNHDDYEQSCYVRMFERLVGFSDEELQTFVNVQSKLNEAFALDVKESLDPSSSFTPQG